MKYVTVFTGLLSFFVCCGQQSGLPADSALANFRNLYPQEKVFVQTDKDAYVSGETIWMKAWCALDEAPSYLSRVLYVDLVNSDGRVLLKKMYLLDSLSSTGADFDLPPSMLSGTYSLNAYTLWMLNFPNYVFKKNVVIYGEDYKTKTKSGEGGKPSISLRFFPEGGDAIYGMVNRIAFKATNSDGLSCAVGGRIVDKTGKKVVDFSSEHDGMGVTEFLFEEGNEYTAVATAPGNLKTSASTVLPKAKEEGVGLKVENNSPNRLFVLVNRAAKAKEKFSVVKVVATLNYQIVFSQILDLDKGETACTINKKRLPAGLLHISLFDRNNLPLAERLAFVENYALRNPVVTVESKSVKPGQQTAVSFHVDSVDGPALSCLITGYGPGDSTTRLGENIASSLLLTSDLRGYVNNPGFYFKDKSAFTLHCLDLLLMTQGWTRYQWSKIQHNEFANLKYPVESAISLRGSVYKTDNKEKITGGNVSFIIKGVDSTSILAEATITDKGEFLLPDVKFAKSAVVAYMGTNSKKQNYIVDVKLEPNYIDTLRLSGHTPSVDLDTARFDMQSALAKTLQSSVEELKKNQSKTLATVTIKTKKMSPTDSLNNAYAGGPFLMGKAVNPAEFKNYQTIWQMIQAAVPGVNIEGNPFDPTVTFSRFAAFGTGSNSQNVSESSNGEISQSVVMETGGIAYFLNEVNVSKGIVNTLTVDDIALIKVLKNEAAALGASQGAIAIYTKQDAGVGGAVYDKRYAKRKIEGFSISKQFYQPGLMPSVDLQTDNKPYTLYWASKTLPSSDGKYRFHFDNNGAFTKLRFVIQGMDKKGNLIYKDYIIE